MISVGIDVSKEKSMVFAADENGEVLLKPCEFEHTEVGMAELIRLLKQMPEEPRVVVENTGYYIVIYPPTKNAHRRTFPFCRGRYFYSIKNLVFRTFPFVFLFQLA